MKVGVVSATPERAASYARVLRDLPGVDLVVAEPHDVLASRPDAVVVATAAAARRDVVERAAGIGARVLCEYPLAPTSADAAAVVDACAAAGVRLTMASPVCFSPAFAVVRNGIADGGLGRLTTMYGTNRGQGHGAAVDVAAPALLDMVDVVLGGQPAEQVYAQANGVLSGGSGPESAALVSVRYVNGVVASIECVVTGPGHRPAGPVMTFAGDQATVEFDLCPRMLDGFDVATSAQRWETGGADPHAVMFRDFLSPDGSGPDGAVGVRTQRIVEAAHESVRTGRPVEVGVPSPVP